MELQIRKSHLEDYNIYVKNYLTYNEIQFIADEAMKCEKYSDRMDVIDKYIIAACVDNPEQFSDVDIELIRGSGLMDKIQHAVENYYLIFDAIAYEENVLKAVNIFLEELTKTVANVAEKFPDEDALKELMQKIPQANNIVNKSKK